MWRCTRSRPRHAKESSSRQLHCSATAVGEYSIINTFKLVGAFLAFAIAQHMISRHTTARVLGAWPERPRGREPCLNANVLWFKTTNPIFALLTHFYDRQSIQRAPPRVTNLLQGASRLGFQSHISRGPGICMPAIICSGRPPKHILQCCVRRYSEGKRAT